MRKDGRIMVMMVGFAMFCLAVIIGMMILAIDVGIDPFQLRSFASH